MARLPTLEQVQAEIERRRYDWQRNARPNQVAPDGDWTYWLILAGRGFGKTRAGAEWVRQTVKTSRFVNLIGATADDARDIMIQGESGILACCPPDDRPVYKKSERKLLWPNGAESLVFTADEPERLRGKQASALWADEIAAWRYPESWDQAKLGLRLGKKPQACITTTPKPKKLIRALIADPATHVTRGSTYDNRANLAPSFFDQIIRTYEGTRLGRQELNAELLEDVPGALWTLAMIDEALKPRPLPDMERIVVAVDPSGVGGADDGGDWIGIIAAGRGVDGRAYVLADRSCKLSPAGWGKRAVDLYDELGADRIIGEANFGGAMIEHVIRTASKSVAYSEVKASRGKVLRAEPVAALYEQGRVSHAGSFPELETQMCSFTNTGYTGEGSPDRLDAMVWACTELLVATPDTTNLGLLQFAKQQSEERAAQKAAEATPTPHIIKPAVSGVERFRAIMGAA